MLSLLLLSDWQLSQLCACVGVFVEIDDIISGIANLAIGGDEPKEETDFIKLKGSLENIVDHDSFGSFICFLCYFLSMAQLLKDLLNMQCMTVVR